MDQTFKRGDAVRNIRTGQVGVVVQAPLYMENNRQWHVAVSVAGRSMHPLWYLAHVESVDPYMAVSAGDTVKVPGKHGGDLTAQVSYVARKREWVCLMYRGLEYVYKGPIVGIMPASVQTMGGK